MIGELEDGDSFFTEKHIGSDHLDDEADNQIMNLQTKQNKSKKLIYGKGNESITIKKELGGFKAFESNSYAYIIKTYGRSIRFNELLGIINSIQIFLEYKEKPVLEKLTRNEKRSFPLLIKYIERNSDVILPYLQYISLCDSSFQRITLDTK